MLCTPPLFDNLQDAYRLLCGCNTNFPALYNITVAISSPELSLLHGTLFLFQQLLHNWLGFLLSQKHTDQYFVLLILLYLHVYHFTPLYPSIRGCLSAHNFSDSALHFSWSSLFRMLQSVFSSMLHPLEAYFTMPFWSLFIMSSLNIRCYEFFVPSKLRGQCRMKLFWHDFAKKSEPYVPCVSLASKICGSARSQAVVFQRRPRKMHFLYKFFSINILKMGKLRLHKLSYL